MFDQSNENLMKLIQKWEREREEKKEGERITKKILVKFNFDVLINFLCEKLSNK